MMSGKTVQHQLNESFHRYKDRIALRRGDRFITYSELNGRTNRLACQLLEKGIKKECFIGILVEDRIEMIAVIIGILKAGGVFIPMSAQLPGDRLESMVHAAGIELIISDKDNAEGLAANKLIHNKVEILTLEELEAIENEPGPGNRIEGEVNHLPGDKIYIYFTSGTTGKPKAIVGKNKGLWHFINWEIETFQIDETFRFSQFTIPTFDVFMRDIFVPLCAGAAVCIPENKEILFNGSQLVDWIERRGIYLMHCVPSLFRLITTHETLTKENFKALKYVLLAGEKVNPAQLKQWYRIFDERVQLVNLYGPTETTLAKVFHLIRKSDLNSERIPIGKPIKGAMVMILDERMNPCDDLEPGEIYIRTPFRSHGYYNDPRLTSQHFIQNPFNDDPRDIIYKTGDLGRWLSDGTIDILGRKDRQVKIRGIRVELEEIEGHLLSHRLVKEAVVIKKEVPPHHELLWAFITGSPGNKKDEADINDLLSDYLAAKLPGYMVPVHITKLENMPRKPNGKIDYNNLPDPLSGPGDERQYPRDEIERRVLRIWTDFFKHKQIGMKDSFFKLGGNSLNVMTFISKVHQEFDRSLSVREVFLNPTIEKLAVLLRNAEQDRYDRIRPVEKKEYYAVSSAQQRLYILQQMEKENIAYNLPQLVHLQEKPHRETLKEIFRQLIQRHHSLRTSFEMIAGSPLQRVHEEVEFEIEAYGAECMAQSAEHRAQSKERCAPDAVRCASFVRPFDLSQAPLLRVGLAKVNDKQYMMMTDMHHVICDGVSLGILIDEFLRLYNGKALPPLRLQYEDYSEWHNNEKEKKVIKRQETYWLKQFEGEIPLLDLPVDYKRSALRSYQGRTLYFDIGREKTEALNQVARGEGVTLYMVLLAIYTIFLSKISGGEDIIVGTPIAGRGHGDIEKIIGMFVNTLALRNYPRGERTFNQLMKDVKKRTLEAFENQEYQFEDLVERLTVNRDTSRNPLFDVMFLLENTGINETRDPEPGLRLKSDEYENTTAKFDLSLNVLVRESLALSFEYSTKLFRSGTVQGFVGYFKTIVDAVLNDPDQPIGRIEIMSRSEKQRVLVEFNGTTAVYPQDKTVIDLFAQQAERTPDNIAVTGSAAIKHRSYMTYMTYISYGELNEKSNQLALLLKERGVQADSIVALKVERSIEMIVGILGILKAGGAYLPIDPGYPDQRIDYMLKDSGAITYLTGQFISEFTVSKGAPSGISTPRGGQLAYIIYTSGSTGKPKGVLVNHKGVMNILHQLEKLYPLGSSDAYLLKTNYTFDVSVTELFGWFFGKGRLVILEKEREKDPEAIIGTIKQHWVTHVNFVPSMFNAFLEILNWNQQNLRGISGLRYIFLAGEALSPRVIRRFRELGSHIVLENIYGPTEATIYASKYSLADWQGADRVPIGKPLPNVKLYILDKYNNLQPIGITGELYISGTGIARGYLNNPQLTARHFVEHRSYETYGLYRTGDLARWLPNGNIEFFGRIDHQLKVRGFRVEPGEIETHLLNHPHIKDALVIDREDEKGEQRYLCTYLVSEQRLEVSRIREYLLDKLPYYMVPSYFVQVENISLTTSGKLDRNALPQPGSSWLAEAYTPPGDEVQETLAEIWADILGIQKEKIGIDVNFFQLGGHSLTAIVMVSGIHKKLNTKLSVVQVFRTPTIRGLSRVITGIGKEKYASIPAVEKKEYYPLSSAQKRMFLLNQVKVNSTSDNTSEVITVEGSLDRRHLENTVRRLIKRHEVLRTSFELVDHQPAQRVHQTVDFKITALEVNSGVGPVTPGQIKTIIDNFVQPFDLSKAPLLRVGLLKLPGNKHLLIYDMHHIASDGTSLQIFRDEFLGLYEAVELPSLRVQYKDFACWQNGLLESGELKKQEDYWLGVFANDIPELDLPTDYPRQSFQSFEGDFIEFRLDSHLIARLNRVAALCGATLYMTLLAIYNILLYKYTGQEDFVVGSSSAGRPHADLQNIIGFFVNTLAMRNYPRGEKTFIQFLKEVKSNALKAYENQDYQFDELVNRLDIPRNLSRQVLFDTHFTLHNIHIDRKNTVQEVKGLIFKPHILEEKTTQFDIIIHATERNDEVHFILRYCIKLFKRETIERFIGYFREIAGIVAENRDIKLKEIEISHDLETAQADMPATEFVF